MRGKRFWGGGGFSERSPSSPDPFSRRAAGVRVRHFGWLGSACEYGRSPIDLVVVTAADRAAATCQRWVRHKPKSERAEGVAGAIGKLPDGLRPPPRLRRGDTVTCGSFAATSCLLPQKEGDHPRQRMVEDIFSLCGGSLLACSYRLVCSLCGQDRKEPLRIATARQSAGLLLCAQTINSPKGNILNVKHLIRTIHAAINIHQYIAHRRIRRDNGALA